MDEFLAQKLIKKLKVIEENHYFLKKIVLINLGCIFNLKRKTLEETKSGLNKQKLKFDDSEFFLDDLPKEAKQLLMEQLQTKLLEI